MYLVEPTPGLFSFSFIVLNAMMGKVWDFFRDCIEHGRYTMAISVLQDSEKVLKKRNKLIHIANKSEGG